MYTKIFEGMVQLYLMFLTTIYFIHGWSQTKNFRGNVEKFSDRMLDCLLIDA